VKKHTFYKRERQYQVRFAHVTVPMFPAFTFGLYPVLLFTMLPYSLNFSAILWRKQVNFQCDDDEVRFVLDQHAKWDFNSAS
jgi:hypothetical protein